MSVKYSNENWDILLSSSIANNMTALICLLVSFPKKDTFSGSAGFQQTHSFLLLTYTISSFHLSVDHSTLGFLIAGHSLRDITPSMINFS